MKTPEELNALKEEVETVSRKLHELTEEELTQVSGGDANTSGARQHSVCVDCDGFSVASCKNSSCPFGYK